MFYGTHDTTGGNIGDSNCSMGRIAWFDAQARKRMRAHDGMLGAYTRAMSAGAGCWAGVQLLWSCCGAAVQLL